MKSLPALAAVLFCSTPVGLAEVPGKQGTPATQGKQVAFAPLAFKAGASTQASQREEELKWFNKYLVAEVSRGWVGKPWKERAVAFVRERLPFLQWLADWEAVTPPKVETASLLDAGCQDPWVRLLGEWDLVVEDEGAYDRMWEAFMEIRASALDPALKRFAALPLLMEEEQLPDSADWRQRMGTLKDEFDSWSTALAGSPCYQGKDADLLLLHLRSLRKVRFNAESMLPLLEQAGNFPAWVLDTIRGEAEIDLAWKSRGSDWAYKVPAEGWAGFRDHLAEARKHLTAAWKARPDQARAASLMITVVMGEEDPNGETARLWFDRATAACLDSANAYNRFRATLLPRWGGSHQQMLDFATACLDSKRFDTFVPMALTDVLADIAAEEKDAHAAYRLPGIAPRLRAMHQGYFTTAVTAQQKADRFALMVLDAWLSGDYEPAYEMLDCFGFPTSPASNTRLEKLGVTWRQIMAEVIIFGGPGGDLARQAESREKAGKPDEAVALWQQWQKVKKVPAWVKEKAAVRLRVAGQQRDYAAGKWVDLPVDRAADWDRPLGSWEEDAKSALVAIGGSPDEIYTAVYPFITGPHFESRTKFRITGVTAQSGHMEPHLQVHAGFKPWSSYATLSATVSLGMGGEGMSGFLSPNSRIEPGINPVTLGGTNSGEVEVALRKTAQGLTMKVNGKTICENFEEPVGSPDFKNGYFAIGAHNLPEGATLTVLSAAVHQLP